MGIVITSAVWDRRGKTQFLTIEGQVEVLSFYDEVEVTIADPQGINPNILLINVEVIPSDGPRKPQMVPFRLGPKLMSGTESWSEIQAVSGDHSATSQISVSTWINDNASINSLIGKRVRIYNDGDSITQDFDAERVNIERDSSGQLISRIWLG